MNSNDDEPRKHPVPVPFCEIVAKPTVPELSLISLDDTPNKPDKKVDPFSGTQFQTYNAWRWKHMNGIVKDNVCDNKFKFDQCSRTDNCVIFKDKYSSMEAEKRKNQILYGHMEEPRQPIMPKQFPEIPKLIDSFPKNNSFEDITLLDDSGKFKTREKLLCSSNSQPTVSKKKESELSPPCLKKNSAGSKKLYDLISEQNKQIEILHQQIEQILRLQDVKDKQISQLLKTQESKEEKIGKLLRSIEIKDNEIEKFLESKEKQEQYVSGLSKSYEDIKKQNVELLKKLDNINKKETHSIATMTDDIALDCCPSKNSNSHSESLHCQKIEDDSCIRNEKEAKENSLSLHSFDLPVIQDHTTSPQSSIHLDIQDFHYSSDESGSETETTKKCLPSKERDSNQLGYTFYNNIMTQVKDIIQNSSNKEHNLGGVTDNVALENNKSKEIRTSTQSFKSCEVFEAENVLPPSIFNPGSHLYKRFPYEPPHNYFQKESYSPSDISLKINSLALKYLKQEQISQYNLDSQIPLTRHPDVTIYNVTNLSFGSARMDKYNIISNLKEQPQMDEKAHFNCKYAKRKILNGSAKPKNNIIEMNTLPEEGRLI